MAAPERSTVFYGGFGLEVVGLGRAGGRGIREDDRRALLEARRRRRAALARVSRRRSARAGLSSHLRAPPIIVCGCARPWRGRLDRAIIRAIIRRQENQLRHCYEQELVLDPKLRLRAVLRLLIESDGRVIEATSSSGHSKLNRCLQHAASLWRFPTYPRHEQFEVRYPIRFVPLR